jgi:thiamine-phosphate pyrophosphorylase
MRGYYFITDAELSLAGDRSDVKAAAQAGVPAVQYRRKYGTTLEMIKEALILKKLCGTTVFLINDRVDIALAAEADGVHLGQDDLPYSLARKLLGRRVIGLTVHNVREAREAQAAGADYLGVSPVFPTRTKQDAGKPAGIELVRRIRKEVRIPIVAIGGITLANAPAVIAAGADAVCAISAVVSKKNVRAEIDKFQKLFG